MVASHTRSIVSVMANVFVLRQGPALH
jgi:hypothetical protein